MNTSRVLQKTFRNFINIVMRYNCISYIRYLSIVITLVTSGTSLLMYIEITRYSSEAYAPYKLSEYLVRKQLIARYINNT